MYLAKKLLAQSEKIISPNGDSTQTFFSFILKEFGVSILG
jgi:hypothetical protein